MRLTLNYNHPIEKTDEGLLLALSFIAQQDPNSNDPVMLKHTYQSMIALARTAVSEYISND